MKDRKPTGSCLQQRCTYKTVDIQRAFASRCTLYVTAVPGAGPKTAAITLWSAHRLSHWDTQEDRLNRGHQCARVYAVLLHCLKIRDQNYWVLTDLTLVLVWPPAVISTRFVTWFWERGGVGVETQRQALIRKGQTRANLGIWEILTSHSIELDFNRSVVVSDDILPENPGAISQVLVVDNLHSPV